MPLMAHGDSDEVTVVESQSTWPADFEAERRLILSAVGPAIGRIEHIGSTAVPGLAAKPILDLMAGLRTLPLGREAIAALSALGYEDLGENGIPGRRFFRKGRPRTHHLHVVEDGSDFWRNHLLFRDYLRGHPEEADAYGRLKRALGERFRADRDAYSNAKTPYIEEVLRKALNDRTVRDDSLRASDPDGV